MMGSKKTLRARHISLLNAYWSNWRVYGRLPQPSPVPNSLFDESNNLTGEPMKIHVRILIGMVFTFWVAPTFAAQMLGSCGNYHCPAGLNPTGLPPNDNNACDPAFVTYERAWASLKQVATNAKRGNLQTGTSLGTSSDVEKALLKALDEAKTLDHAWAVTAEAWKSEVSTGLQRQALAQVRSMTKTSSDGETANFMLSALENPAAEMERCREWGRGTALDRKKAADRLALLLQNPNLVERFK